MSHAKAMDRDNARDLIVAAFRTRMRTTPFAKLRVSDLIKELGLNRNTFYYHFSGKGDLALFAFREDLDRRLRTIAPERELLTQGPGDDPFAGLAFYASVETGAHTLEHGAFVRCLLGCIRDDTLLYRNLLTDRGQELACSLRALWNFALLRDIDFILAGRYMDDRVKTLLAHQEAIGLIGLARYATNHPDVVDALIDDRINPFCNYAMESIHNAIQKHPLTPLGDHATEQPTPLTNKPL